MPSPLRSRIGYELKRAQHGLRSAMDRDLRRLGLTTPQYAVLASVRENPAISGAGLARAAFVSAQTMNEVLAGLERAGLVRRTQSAKHGRVIETHLTSAGLGALEEADLVVAEAEVQLTKALSQDEQELLLRLLQRCADQIDRRVEASPAR